MFKNLNVNWIMEITWKWLSMDAQRGYALKDVSVNNIMKKNPYACDYVCDF